MKRILSVIASVFIAVSAFAQILPNNSTQDLHNAVDKAGSALSGKNTALMCGGSDGTSVRFLSVDTSGRLSVGGAVANDAVMAGNPVAAGALAVSAFQTSVGTGDMVRLTASLDGKLVIEPYSISQASVSGAIGPIAAATNTSLIATQGATNRTYVSNLIVVNDSATLNTVTITDGSGGATIFQARMLANSYISITFPKPLRFSLNTAVFVNTSAVSSVWVSAAGYYSPN